MIQNWFENALATENWWSIVPVCSSIAIVTVYICSIHSAKTAKMVLTKEEHKQATMAVNALHPPSWLNNDFKQNWFCRLDYKNSSHLEACLIDRDLQQILHANLGQTPEGLKAKQYNHEVAHNVDDVRYFKKPALGIYIGPHYQWDDATSKPAMDGYGHERCNDKYSPYIRNSLKLKQEFIDKCFELNVEKEKKEPTKAGSEIGKEAINYFIKQQQQNASSFTRRRRRKKG